MKENKSGGPKGKTKTSRLDIMINSDIKKKFYDLVYKMGSNPSVKINEMIVEFLAEHGGDKIDEK